MVVVQTEERNMYDQHWLCTVLKERYPFLTLYIYWLKKNGIKSVLRKIKLFGCILKLESFDDPELT